MIFRLGTLACELLRRIFFLGSSIGIVRLGSFVGNFLLGTLRWELEFDILLKANRRGSEAGRFPSEAAA